MERSENKLGQANKEFPSKCFPPVFYIQIVSPSTNSCYSGSSKVKFVIFLVGGGKDCSWTPLQAAELIHDIL